MLRLGKTDNVNAPDPKPKRVPQNIKRTGMTPATVRFLAGDSLRQLLILKYNLGDVEGLTINSAMRKLVKTIIIAMRENAETLKTISKIKNQSKQ